MDGIGQCDYVVMYACVWGRADGSRPICLPTLQQWAPDDALWVWEGGVTGI